MEDHSHIAYFEQTYMKNQNSFLLIKRKAWSELTCFEVFKQGVGCFFLKKKQQRSL